MTDQDDTLPYTNNTTDQDDTLPYTKDTINQDETFPYSADETHDETLPHSTNELTTRQDETLPYSTKRKHDNLRIATFNCNGLKKDFKKLQLVEDAQRYRLDAISIQETKIKDTTTEKFTTQDGKKTYIFHTAKTSNHYSGTGFLVDEDLGCSFTEVNDRICYIKFSINKRPYYVVNAYAPTNPVSNCIKTQGPEKRQDFYDALEELTQNFPNRAVYYIDGDFNAKTGTGHETYPEVIGKYGKGKLSESENDNGRSFCEFAKKNGLTATNTHFNHKLAHRTTWEQRFTQCGKRNPVRNQIDYILTKTTNLRYVTDCRSYSGTITDSDHRLVIANTIIPRHKTPQNKTKTNNLHGDALTDTQTREAYQNAFTKHYKQETTPQKIWTNIIHSIQEAIHEIKPNKHQGNKDKQADKHIRTLSQQQKQIRQQINATTNKDTRHTLQQKRNKILQNIHKATIELDNQKLQCKIREIEQSTNNCNKMYKAIQELFRTKKKPLCIDTEDGTTANPNLATIAITKYFKSVFNAENQTKIPTTEPTPMQKPFTTAEIQSAATALKNNKSPGVDNIQAEHIKYGPEQMHTEIANMLNTTAKTGQYPKELKHGLLVALQKPGKQSGPLANLRPIILFSVSRKLLALSLIRRISSRINEQLPTSQAAYRPGRSTTEHIFAIKLLCEKAITSTNYTIHLLLLDMSKAFDTIDRGKLHVILSDILDKDEMHMIKILLEDVELQVKNDKTLGQIFKTNIGSPQGDSLSALFFIMYMAMTLRRTDIRIKPPPPHLAHDHTYATRRQTIDLQYADDISYMTEKRQAIEDIKEQVPDVLKQDNLNVNATKTEQYEIKRKGPEDWKKCKYLGTLLNTEDDIIRRKMLTNAAFNKHKVTLTNTRLPLDTRLKLFDTFVKSIFMYSSETWTLTMTSENKIDSYHRRLLRRILKIHWPHIMRNDTVYDRTKQNKWSTDIRINRLRWTGHLLRLPEETPARLALKESKKRTKHAPGRQATTWIKLINQDLQAVGLSDIYSNETREIAQDRKLWKTIALHHCDFNFV